MQPVRHHGWKIALLLGAILAALFHRSFLPGEVLFSNDTPLGLFQAEAYRLPQALCGVWGDLNYIGSYQGSGAVNLSYALLWLLGPVAYAGFYAPLTLLLVGLSAWFAFRQMRLSPTACMLGALAAMLNSQWFSAACWGVASHCITVSFCFLAFGLVLRARRLETEGNARQALACLGLAGFSLGLCVAEGLDIGALFCLLFATWIVVDSIFHSGHAATGLRWSLPRLVAVALLAGWFAAHSIVTLVSSNVSGIAGTAQDAATREQRWDWATQWSLPKRETLGIAVPGLFGYRMDAGEGGNYWGACGRDPAWDQYFAAGGKGSPPAGMIRYAGGGSYAGILVILIAGWAVWHSLRRSGGVFDASEQRQIWFWSAVALVCLLLGFGRHAPFYQALYALPYVSTIRNPVKFMHLVQFALVMLFALGVHRMPLQRAGAVASLGPNLRGWLAECAWGLTWLTTSGALLLLVAGGLLAYRASQPALVEYLTQVDFTRDEAVRVAAFSWCQAAWFAGTLVLTLAGLMLVFSGWAAHWKAWAPGVLLGVLLMVDLSRANSPWIVYSNARERYAPDAITAFLAPRTREGRVATWPFPVPEALLSLDQMYRLEWLQHQFPYHNVRSLDLVQMRSIPQDLLEFSAAFRYEGVPTLPRVTRQWEVANIRYVLAPAGFLKVMHRELDPVQQRFRIVERFDIVARPGIASPLRSEEFTAVSATNGSFAIFEFSGALPRAGFYSHWETVTNRAEALARLPDPAFDPSTTVLVEGLAGVSSGVTALPVQPVPLVSYTPRNLTYSVTNASPGVLLLSERFDPRWRVSVDGASSTVLVCNGVFRGVHLPAGSHRVEFVFQPIVYTLWISGAAVLAGLLLLGTLSFIPGPRTAPESALRPAP